MLIIYHKKCGKTTGKDKKLFHMFEVNLSTFVI